MLSLGNDWQKIEEEDVAASPNPTFRSFRAAKSIDRQIGLSSDTLIPGFRGTKFAKCLDGFVTK